MSIGVAPFTHRTALYRAPCPVCRRETIHRLWRCIHCHTDNSPPRGPTRKAFGHRLVITRFRIKL